MFKNMFKKIKQYIGSDAGQVQRHTKKTVKSNRPNRPSIQSTKVISFACPTRLQEIWRIDDENS